jgi:uncharacterized membrane protein
MMGLAVWDWAAAGGFVAVWLAYIPMLRKLGEPGGFVSGDMATVREAWMANMVSRDNSVVDSQLLGHALATSTFMTSTTLAIIAGLSGVLFGGDAVWRAVQSAPFIATASPLIHAMKLGLVLIVLGRSLVAFIWALRQYKYLLAIIGARPLGAEPTVRAAWAKAATDVMGSAVRSFSVGLGSYYLAFAAAAWMLGPLAMAIATAAACALLFWRQNHSVTAQSVNALAALARAEAQRRKDNPTQW